MWAAVIRVIEMEIIPYMVFPPRDMVVLLSCYVFSDGANDTKYPLSAQGGLGPQRILFPSRLQELLAMAIGEHSRAAR